MSQEVDSAVVITMDHLKVDNPLNTLRPEEDRVELLKVLVPTLTEIKHLSTFNPGIGEPHIPICCKQEVTMHW